MKQSHNNTPSNDEDTPGCDKGRRILEVLLTGLVILIGYFIYRGVIQPAKERSLKEEYPGSESMWPFKKRRPRAPVPSEYTQKKSDPVAAPVGTPVGTPRAQTGVQQGSEQVVYTDHVTEYDAKRKNVGREEKRNAHGNTTNTSVLRILRISRAQAPTPVYQIRDQLMTAKATRLWHVITVEYESKPQQIDELTFDYYVMLGKERDGAAAMVSSKRVTYLNTEPGVHRSVMYLHPNTFARFGPARKIGILVTSGGNELAYATLPGDQGRSWLTVTDSLRLLYRRDTPFWLIDHDSFEYEEVTSKGQPIQSSDPEGMP